MAKSTYTHQLARRRRQVTDYKERERFLWTDLPFTVVRRSNSFIYADVSKPTPAGDDTLASANSKEILKRFDLVSGKNLPAALLTGILAGRRSVEAGRAEAHLYLGPAWTADASIPFAAVQGCIKAGLEIALGEGAEVEESRLYGEHIAAYYEKLEEEETLSDTRQFQRYQEQGVSPSSLPELVRDAEEQLLEG